MLFLASANSNFTLYLESLKKMEMLQIDYLCADHFGYVFGNEAKSYISSSMVFGNKGASPFGRHLSSFA